MNDAYVLVPIFGLVSFVGAIVGLLYFEWYERHQREWRIQLERVRQVAIAETLARPKPIKIIKPHRLYTPPKPASPCDCPHCRLMQIQKEAMTALSVSLSPSSATATPNPSDPTSATGEDSAIDSDVTALQRGLLPAYLWPFIRNDDVIPYSQTKSNRGRRKQYSTAGAQRACPHLDCDYCGITDEA